MTQTTYKGRAPQEDYRQLLELLDNVFFLDDEEPKRDFLSLLPKLYKEKYDPCRCNFIVKEDGSIKSAVGLYPSTCVAAGQEIRIGGIGNVAVARNARNRGYMIESMNMAVKAAIEDSADISMLGGDRQRYGYFGFEPMGVEYSFEISKRNLRHAGLLGVENVCEALKVGEGDTGLIGRMQALIKRYPYYSVRPEAMYIDIMSSWSSTPYAVVERGEFKGYFVIGRQGGINELMPVNNEEWYKLIICAMELTGKESFELHVPTFNTALAETLASVCGSMSVRHSEAMNVYNYENVIRGFLGVKAQAEELSDGRLVLLIHGIRCDEQLEISVNNSRVRVEKTTKKPEMELEHHEAERLIGSLCSSKRLELPSDVRQWFPLPLFCYSLDAV